MAIALERFLNICITNQTVWVSSCFKVGENIYFAQNYIYLVLWKVSTLITIYAMLHQPVYLGVYVFSSMFKFIPLLITTSFIHLLKSMDNKLCILLFPFECLFQHHMWRGCGYVILVILLAVFFNLNTFFEFTYGTYSEIYCAEASGCEGWVARQLSTLDSHSCIFTRETSSWSSDGHLFIQFTALKMDPIYNSLSIGFSIIEGKGGLPCT